MSAVELLNNVTIASEAAVQFNIMYMEIMSLTSGSVGRFFGTWSRDLNGLSFGL